VYVRRDKPSADAITDQTNLDGKVPGQGSLIGSDALIPTDLMDELMRSAKLRPLTHPADAPPRSRL
jgi:hypothetical protein